MMEGKKPLRVGILGCGQIAWIHLSHLLRLKLATVVGVCDFERAQAEKTAQVFKIPRFYSNAEEMLTAERPDVVHVTTPPATHAAVTIQALRAGAHVLVEKPMALTVEEADQMIEAARETGRQLCVDHNRLFGPSALQARELLETGQLGQLVGADFFQGFGLPPGMTPSVVRNQWFAKLPGGLIQDLAPHGLSFLLEYVGPPVRMHILTKNTGALSSAAPADEIRVMVEGERILGTYTISLGTQPFMNHFTLYGTKMTARVNIDNFTLVVRKNRDVHPILNKALGGIDEGRQLVSGTIRNTIRFATKKLPRYPDIAEVIRRFYASLQAGGAPPVTMEQGREVVRQIQEVVQTIEDRSPRPRKVPAVVAPPARSDAPRILITGATGFVGGALLRRLMSQGECPRVLARQSPRALELQQSGVDVVLGDLSDDQALATAVQGVEVVYHCAARMGPYGTWQDFLRDNVEGTEHLLRACQKEGVRKFLYLSSLAVYGPPRSGKPIAEQSPYDPQPEKRGNYSYSKILAEKRVLEFAQETGLPVTIFRPGLIYGPGRPLPTAPLAFPFGGKFMVIGKSRSLIPLNYIENLIDALLAASERPGTINRQFNIIDDEQVSYENYHRARGQCDGTRAVFVPGWPFRIMAPGIQLLVAVRGGGGKLASFSSHALARVLKSVQYDTREVRAGLGWQPRVPLQEALKSSIS
jgi:predicted dehydrogenase/nucleoside-diphosphate-sugar epimerase